MTVKRDWPGPRGHWLLGCLRPLQKDPLKFYEETWRTYGDYVRIRAFTGVHFYFLAHPAAIEHVLYKSHKNYRKPDVFNKPMRLLTGNGLLTSEGDDWLQHRRLAQPAFLRPHLAKLSPHIVAAVEALIRDWEQAAVGRKLDIAPEMMRLALRIASTALFSTDISGEADAIGRAYRVALAQVGDKMNARSTLPLWIPARRNREFRQSKALLDRVVLQLIEARRRREATTNDVLDMLLAAQDEESTNGLTDQQVRNEIITLLTAGHESVGAALSWAWYLLGQHPDIQQALHDEVSARLQGRTPTAEDLPRLPLATAILEETMRLYPPAWGIPRQAISADEINGYPVPFKAILTLSQWVTHRHPAFWEEPNRFNPERFLFRKAEDRARMAYFPFGGGPRACIGNNFAMTEGPLVIAALAQVFRFGIAPGHPVIPDATFTLRPKTGVQVIVAKYA